MEYASLTFWMLVIVFAALGVHRLWSSLVQPRVVNSLLLPGTLVATVGHVIGMLITGGTVNNTTLVKDDATGEPQTGSGEIKTRVPFVGTVIIALLPMVGCAVAIYWIARYLGSPILAAMEQAPFDRMLLPTSLPLFFATVRELLTLVERLVNVIRQSDLRNWQTLLFLYLVVCMTVRMAPLSGNVRGALGAILLTGVLTFLIGQATGTGEGSAMGSAWPLVTFCVAVSLLLLILSLLATGAVHLVRTLLNAK